MKQKKQKVNRTFSIDEDVSKKLDTAAQEQGRSFSSLVNFILRKALK